MTSANVTSGCSNSRRVTRSVNLPGARNHGATTMRAAPIERSRATASVAEGSTEVAKQAGLTRASLYKALSAEGRPEFATVLKVVRALGLKITVAA